MKLNDLYNVVAPYVVLIQLIKTENDQHFLLGSSSGFLTGDGYLITNFHVMQDFLIGVNQGENYILQLITYNFIDGKPVHQGWQIKGNIVQNILTGYYSEEQANDYIILNMDIKRVFTNNPYINIIMDFACDNEVYVGQKVCIFGYPFGKENLSMNQGIISSIYERCGVKVFQIDGIVNKGNSGGPLIDVETGKVIGIVSRKEDGLNEMFDKLKDALKQNIDIMHEASNYGGFFINDINQTKALEISFVSMYEIVNHIERSANVGIGYAFSVNKIVENLKLLREERDNSTQTLITPLPK